METGTLTSKGHTTIPKTIRQRLGLKPGYWILHIIRDGEVVLRPANRPNNDLEGALPAPASARSLEQIENATAEGATKA